MYYLRLVQNKLTNIILIGFMGSGKSTLGKKIAKKLKVDHIDTDAEIERRTGMKIHEIFDRFGEEHFRNLEQTLLIHLKLDSRSVISCGGGMPCFRNNLENLKQFGVVCYLKRSPKELYHRLISSKSDRPLLQKHTEENLLSYIEGKLEERKKIYEMAHLVLERNEQTVENLLTRLNAKK